MNTVTIRLAGNNVCVGQMSGSRGCGDLRTVVLLHGAGLDHTYWQALAETLSKNAYDVFAPDLPAHGGSDGEPLDDIQSMSDWLHQLMVSLKIVNPDLIGHSMGALTGLQFSAEHSDSYRTLITLGCAYPMPVSPELLRLADEDASGALKIVRKYGVAAESAGLAVLEQALATMQKSAGPVLRNGLQACDGFKRSPEFFRAIQSRLTLINGTEDRMTPTRNALGLQQLVTGSRYIAVTGGGHFLPLECRQDTTAAVLEALQA